MIQGFQVRNGMHIGLSVTGWKREHSSIAKGCVSDPCNNANLSSRKERDGSALKGCGMALGNIRIRDIGQGQCKAASPCPARTGLHYLEASELKQVRARFPPSPTG